MAASVQFCWPSAFRNLAVCVQNLVAADTPGEDGPLLGIRDSPEYHDKIYLGDFYSSCTAARARKSSLIVPGGLPVTARVEGEALIVLHTVVCDWPV
jgi:hypothetical protein